MKIAQTGARKAARPVAEMLSLNLTISNWIIVACVLLFAVPLLGFQSLQGFDTGKYFMQGQSEALILMGAMYEPWVMGAGHWWRLVMPVFLHGGVFHLAMNMYVLTVLGPMVENIYGRGWFFFLWVVTGVAGATASWYGTPKLSTGASGALFGLLGVGIAQAYRHRLLNEAILRQLSMWAGFGFLLSFVTGFDNWAHGGGFISGLALGWLLPHEKVRRLRSRAKIGGYLGWASLALCTWCFYEALCFAKDFIVPRSQ